MKDEGCLNMLCFSSLYKSVNKHKQTIEYIVLFAILLLAAYLRLYKISEYMTFLGDEGRDAMVVKRMIVDHKFTLLGPTASVGGFFLGPVYYYFMLPFLWLWNLDPTGPAVMVALFGILTVYMVYKTGKDFFHPVVGLTAALLYALSPVVIAYSRSSWNPNLVQFFSLCLVYLLWRSIEQKNISDFFWIGVIIGIGLQLHYLFLFLVVMVCFWYVLYGRSKECIKGYIYGIIGFITGFSPYLAFELRHGFPNTGTIIRFIFFGEETGFEVDRFLSVVYDVAERLFGRLVYRIPEPGILAKKSQIIQYFWTGGVRLTLAAVIVFFFIVISKRYKKLQNQVFSHVSKKTFVLLILWLLVPLFLFGLYQKGIYDYYFGIFFALPFLLVSLILFVFMKSKKTTGFAVVLLLFLVWLNWEGMPFRYPPNKQLEQAMTISKKAFELAGNKPFNFALITDGNSDHVFRYFFDVWGNAPVVIENEEIDPGRNTVTEQLIVICEKKDCKPLGHPLWEIAGFGQAEIVETVDVPFVTIMKLVHYET